MRNLILTNICIAIILSIVSCGNNANSAEENQITLDNNTWALKKYEVILEINYFENGELIEPFIYKLELEESNYTVHFNENNGFDNNGNFSLTESKTDTDSEDFVIETRLIEDILYIFSNGNKWSITDNIFSVVDTTGNNDPFFFFEELEFDIDKLNSNKFEISKETSLEEEQNNDPNTIVESTFTFDFEFESE